MRTGNICLLLSAISASGKSRKPGNLIWLVNNHKPSCWVMYTCSWQKRVYSLSKDTPVLEKREPFKATVQTETSAAPEEKTINLGDYCVWQDQLQPSFYVGPSSLRDSFVELMGKKEKDFPLCPSMDDAASCSKDNVVFNRPLISSSSARTIPNGAASVSEPKKRPRLKSAKTKVDDSSLSTIHRYTSPTFYTTSSGEKINLAEVFTTTSISRQRQSRNRRYQYEYIRSAAEPKRIRTLRTKEITLAMKDYQNSDSSTWSCRRNEPPPVPDER